LVIGFKGTAKTIFENKWLILGGKLSYAIYLLHNFVPGILLEIKKLDLPIGVEFIIYFIFTVLLSYLLNKAVEKPIRRLGQKFQIK
jgi:peptidoglycan/LPS O-acetylase OafA/YrhL